MIIPKSLSRQSGILFLGVLSLLLYLGMARLSQQFNWGEGYADRPIPTYLFLYATLFITYALAVAKVLKAREDCPSPWTILIFGLLFRVCLLPAHQIQEDDIYRYLWDGKVFAHKVNPYKYSPAAVSDYKRFAIREPEVFRSQYSLVERNELALLYGLKWKSDRSMIFMERINHPDVPTIYPPLTQYIFRMVHQVSSDSILAMRFGFLLFDLITLGFIVLLLETLGKNPALCLIYFWSPLIIKETFNSTHLDIVGIAVLSGSFYFLIRRFWVSAMGFLALGVMGKFYPAILFPLYIREMILDPSQGRFFSKTWVKVGSGIMVFIGVLTICYFPFLGAGNGTFTGLKTFTTFWQNNDSLFALLVFFYKNLLGLEQSFTLGQEALWLSYDLPTFLSKLTVATMLIATVLFYTIFRRSSEPQETIRQSFIIMAWVFLLSPVQNPWYLNWLVPFLCVFPSRAWLLLTGLISFYYLDFFFDYQKMTVYGDWLPWFEFTPFYVLLVFDYWNDRRQEKTQASSHSKPIVV